MPTSFVKILSWDSSQAISSNPGTSRAFVRDSLVGILVESNSMHRTDAKRLIRAVLAQESWEIPISDLRDFEVIRNRLESLGATVSSPLRST